jgi:hypothetical protein
MMAYTKIDTYFLLPLAIHTGTPLKFSSFYTECHFVSLYTRSREPSD